jgi:hypothetical protein
MAEAKLCSKIKTNGEPCKARALPGRDVCFSHARTSEDQRTAQQGQARARRAKKRDPMADFRYGTFAKLTDTTAKLFTGVPLSSPDSARLYLGRREEVTPEAVNAALMLLIALTGPHATPKEARAALIEALPESLRPSFIPPVEDVYKVGRIEWRKASVMYREATGLFVNPYPPTLIAPWEDRDTVERNEPLPSYEDWTVGPLGDSRTHVRARSPEGDDVIVRRAEGHSQHEREKRASAQRRLSA